MAVTVIRVPLPRPSCGLRFQSRNIGTVELQCSFMEGYSGVEHCVEIVGDRIVCFGGIIENAVRTGVLYVGVA
jgi:hypothetical protein